MPSPCLGTLPCCFICWVNAIISKLMSFSTKVLWKSLHFIMKETVHKSFAFIHKMNCFLDIPTQPSATWREDLNGNKVFMWVDDHKETSWARAFRLALQRLESSPFCWTAVHQVKFSWKMFPLWNSEVSTYILQQCMTESNWEWQSTALPKWVQTQSSWLNRDAPIGNAPQAFSSGKRLCLHYSCSHMW